MIRLLGIILLLLIIPNLSPAQQIPVDERLVREEMRKRGIEESDQDAIRKKLEQRGFDLDNIDPSQVGALEKALAEVIAEIEQEKKANAADSAAKAAEDVANDQLEEKVREGIKDVAKEGIDEVQDAVERGDPLDKALAEEIIDVEDKLPPTKVYGQNFFRDKSIAVFNQASDVSPPDSYILGPGDKVNISIWGLSQEDATYEINKAGFIKPSVMPRINLKGMDFGKAKSMLESRFAQYYRFRPEEFEVTITYARTITINIYGEVFSPGSFTIPATNTAFNALIASGGPSDIGSVRNIKLHREGEIPRQIDVYEFMNNPSVREDFYLQENDFIHVPVAERVVSIQGAVRRAFKYELIEGENLLTLIEYAGGLDDNAYRNNIQIKRYVDDEERLIDVNLSQLLSNGQNFPLLSGDEVIVNVIPKPYKNFVSVDGAVEIPGKYEMSAGMKISDLMEKGGLAEVARIDIAFLLRTNADGTVNYSKVNLENIINNPASTDNINLQPRDRLLVLAQTTYVDQANLVVRGAVRNPSVHQFDPSEKLKVEDAIILAGGLRRDAAAIAYIKRPSFNNSKQVEYLRVNLSNALADPNSIDNLVLKPNDSLQVLSSLTYTDEFFVRVSGAVRQPGTYKYDESLNLKDVLTLAGGLRIEAAKSRIDISRVVIQENEPTRTTVATLEVDENFELAGSQSDLQLEPFDQIFVRRVPEFQLQQNITINGEVKFPGDYPLISDNERIASLLSRAGGLTKEAFLQGATLYRPDGGTGYVILDLKEVLDDKNSLYNYILKTGDIIDIPKQNDLVTIKMTGTRSSDLYPDKVLSQGKFNAPFHKGKRARYYVEEYAAGIGGEGRSRLITVEHPNGQIERTKNFGLFRVYPKVRKGSVITVGKKKPKPEKEKSEKEKEEVDWNKVIANTVAQASAVLTLVLLIQQINR
ncbi:MAG: SLBB domain-containing protein [Bacteroidota bacterium]